MKLGEKMGCCGERNIYTCGWICLDLSYLQDTKWLRDTLYMESIYSVVLIDCDGLNDKSSYYRFISPGIVGFSIFAEYRNTWT